MKTLYISLGLLFILSIIALKAIETGKESFKKLERTNQIEYLQKQLGY